MAQKETKRQKENSKPGESHHWCQAKVKVRFVRQSYFGQTKGFETTRYDWIFQVSQIGKEQQDKVTIGSDKQVLEIVGC